MNDDYRHDHHDEDEEIMDSAADAELDQIAAAVKNGAPILTMMFFELTRCGLSREDAASVAAAWFVASGASA